MKKLFFLLALVAVLTAAGPAGASAGSAITYKECGKASVGYTNASVFGHRVRCQFARTLVRRWVRVVNNRTCDESNNYCQVAKVRRWRCVKGGGEGLVRLRCVAGRKRVRAAWGD